MVTPAAEDREQTVAGPRAVWRIVRRRDFGPYFLGNALSASGTWFQNLAAALLIYRLTHSALLLGVLNFSQFIPIAHAWGVRVAGVVLATPALLAALAVTVSALRQRRDPLRRAAASAASAASSGSLRSPEGR